MYRHLLVPIDETDLSTLTIGKAAEFARCLGARITFFHVQVDYTASFFGDAEAVRVTSPEDFAYNYQGRTRELLVKAESAARAQGVTSAVASTVSDTPHEAIIAAARKANCDLIFMASHGRRSSMGMMLGSQTLKVLMNSEIPVLVSSTRNPSVPALAVGIIRDEHRSLAAVLHASLHELKKTIAEGRNPDREVMRAIVYYIKSFPVALHHPKEEDYLFSKLRLRTHEFDAELDELKRQHERSHELVEQLSEAVESYCGGTATLDPLYQVLNRYAVFSWEHMGREESVLLPAAQHHLTEADWEEINEAFSHNQDPRFGGSTDVEFRHLFSRIVELVPPSDAT